MENEAVDRRGEEKKKKNELLRGEKRPEEVGPGENEKGRTKGGVNRTRGRMRKKGAS